MECRTEEPFLYVLLALVCTPVVVSAIERHGIFDSSATICALLMLFALYGLCSPAVTRMRQRVPTARIHGGKDAS